MKATKFRPILADPFALHAAGIRSVNDVCVFTFIGRCGIVGARRKGVAEALRLPYETVRSGVERLLDLGLVTSMSRDSGPGSAVNYVVTRKGWDLLTTPADLTLFPQQKATV